MEEIKDYLRATIKRLFDVDFTPEVTVAPENMHADYSTNAAMKLAGLMKSQLASASSNSTGEATAPATTPKTPLDIATDLEKVIASDRTFPFDAQIAGPGFLNFISRDVYFKQKIADLRHNFHKIISSDEYLGKTVICEFSDPNPFKVLHVGHLYTSIVGDSISRLIEHAGGKVIRANFGGDVGLHVAKTLYAIQKTHADAKDIEAIAKCYVEGTRAYEDDAAARAKITSMNKEIYDIVKRDLHEGPLAQLYWQGRETSYRYFEDFYQKIGVKFDKYYPESLVAGLGLLKVSEGLAAGVYEESHGAVIFPGEKYGLHTRVFINAEGLPTYEAKDVGLIFKKWEDYHFDKSIVITGNDIIDYMKVVLKSVSEMAPELVEKTTHLTHGNVRLPGNEKMSSRKGNFIRAVDVLEQVASSIGDTQVSAITLSAIKYAFLKYKIGGNIEFDVKESVSTTGNSGVYLQYSAVRAKKILAGVSVGELDFDAWELTPHEKSLIKKLCEYPLVLGQAISELAPHKIATYLYETAQEFSKFYEHVKVAGSDYESERAELVAAYLDIIIHGLSLLGIETVREM